MVPGFPTRACAGSGLLAIKQTIETAMISLSCAACQMSCQELVERARSTKQPVVMWTFTFVNKTGPCDAANSWHRLAVRLHKEFPYMGGVRVFELHPDGHGIHIHCLVAGYFDKKKIEALLPAGMGFVFVRECLDLGIPERLGLYLAKYLRKSVRSRPVDLRGVRLWGVWGNFRGTRVRDVHFHSTFGEFLKRAKSACLWNQSDFDFHFDFDPYWSSLRRLSLELARVSVLRGRTDETSRIWSKYRKILRFRIMRIAYHIWRTQWNDSFQELFDSLFPLDYFQLERKKNVKI